MVLDASYSRWHSNKVRKRNNSLNNNANSVEVFILPLTFPSIYSPPRLAAPFPLESYQLEQSALGPSLLFSVVPSEAGGKPTAKL